MSLHDKENEEVGKWATSEIEIERNFVVVPLVVLVDGPFVLIYGEVIINGTKGI